MKIHCAILVGLLFTVTAVVAADKTVTNKLYSEKGEAGQQVSAEKSRFCQESVEYLGFQLKRTGYEPVPSRVSAILRINPPTDVSGVRRLLGVVNFIKITFPAEPKSVNRSLG